MRQELCTLRFFSVPAMASKNYSIKLQLDTVAVSRVIDEMGPHLIQAVTDELLTSKEAGELLIEELIKAVDIKRVD